MAGLDGGADMQVRLWGTHLAEELPRIYASESAAAVVFVSADYGAGDCVRAVTFTS